MDFIRDELYKRLGDDPNKKMALDEFLSRSMTPSAAGAPPEPKRKEWGQRNIDTRLFVPYDPSFRKGLESLTSAPEPYTEDSIVKNLGRFGRNVARGARNLAMFPYQAAVHPVEAGKGLVEGAAEMGTRLLRGVDPQKEAKFLKTSGEFPGFEYRVNKWLAQQQGQPENIATVTTMGATVKPYRLTDAGPEWLSPTEEKKAKAYLQSLPAAAETRRQTAFQTPVETAMMMEGVAKGTGIGGVKKTKGEELQAKTGADKEMLAAGVPSIGPQKVVSKVAGIINDPKFPEKQPVQQWIQLLQTKQFPKNDPVVNKTLTDLKKRPLKERMTKEELQGMLNEGTPQLETVLVKNPTHPEREGELFVRDPNEFMGSDEMVAKIEELKSKKSILEKERKDIANKVTDIFRKFYNERNTGVEEMPKNHPDYPELSRLRERREQLIDELEVIENERVSLIKSHRYDGHSWARRPELSEPLGRTGFYTRENPDGGKTLVIDNFQMPTGGSGGREAMPPEHAKRAYDVMAQSILNYARENGYDNVEWTTGAEQNRRWGVDVPEPTGEWEHFTQDMSSYGGEPWTQDVWSNGNLQVLKLRDGQYVAHPPGSDYRFPTLEAAKEAALDKGSTPEGDLRPLYDKTLPKLMEKYSLGEKVNKISDSTHETKPPIGLRDWDDEQMRIYVDDKISNLPNDTLREIFALHKDSIPEKDLHSTIRQLLDDFSGVDLYEFINITPELYDKIPVNRQSVSVKGQRPQPILYSKTGVPIRGGSHATQKREEQEND